MRRTRHVVLPVKSWQYMGLLLVSLACLTLGHVSRDREGRAGSLAGPELKHTAPHEVDACPNGIPVSVRSPTNDKPAPPKGLEGTLNRASRSLDHIRRIQERSPHDSRREFERSANRRDLRSRIAHQSRDTRQVRADQENQRLIRLRNSRNEERSVSRSDDRRSISLDRRIPVIRQIRVTHDERFTDPSRLLQRGPPERSLQRTSRLDRVRASISADRRAQSTDRISREDRNVRNLQTREHKKTRRELRVESSRLEFQRSVERRELNAERQESARRMNSRLSERSSRNRNVFDERRSVGRLSSNLDRQKRSIPSTSELRRSNTESSERSVDTRKQNIRFVRSNDGSRSDTQQSVDRLQARRSERQERLTRGPADLQKSGARAANRRVAERREVTGIRQTDVRTDDNRSDRAQVRDSDRRARLTRERLGVRRSSVALDRSNEQMARNRRTSERREIRISDRQNGHSERVQLIRRNRSHSVTRREVPWVESLRRVDTISRSSRVPDTDRRQVERLTREDRRLSLQGNREKSKERQFVRADDNRDGDRTRVNKNYLVTVPYLTNNKITENQNYELLKEVFVLALCTIYTASIFQKKNNIVKNTLTKAARFLAW